MNEGRKSQIVLLDERRLDILIQVSWITYLNWLKTFIFIRNAFIVFKKRGAGRGGCKGGGGYNLLHSVGQAFF